LSKCKTIITSDFPSKKKKLVIYKTNTYRRMKVIATFPSVLILFLSYDSQFSTYSLVFLSILVFNEILPKKLKTSNISYNFLPYFIHSFYFLLFSHSSFTTSSTFSFYAANPFKKFFSLSMYQPIKIFHCGLYFCIQFFYIWCK